MVPGFLEARVAASMIPSLLADSAGQWKKKEKEKRSAQHCAPLRSQPPDCRLPIGSGCCRMLLTSVVSWFVVTDRQFMAMPCAVHGATHRPQHLGA